MPVLLKDLLVGRGKLECVEQLVKVRDALQTMMKHDYSQLPIVDRHGQLIGLISEKSIARTHFDYSESFTLDLTANDCSAPAITMRDDGELTEALDRIKNIDAIVIVNDANKPVGILTDYDMTQFLRDLYEAYTLLEDIEGSIDDLIEAALSTENIRNAALFHAFGASKRDPSKPNREFGDLTLHEKAQLIITDEN